MSAWSPLEDEIQRLYLQGEMHKILEKETEIKSSNNTKLLLILQEAGFDLGYYANAMQITTHLETLLENKKSKDAISINIHKIQILARLGKLEEAEKLSLEIQHAGKNVHSLLGAKFCIAQALLCRFRGKYLEAISLLDQVLDNTTGDDITTKAYWIKVLSLKSFCLYFYGGFTEGLQVARDALDLAKEINHGYLVAYSMIMMGNNLQHLKQLKEATQCFLDSLELCVESRFVLGIAACHGNLSEIYRDLGELDSAIYHVSKAIELDSGNQNQRNNAIGYSVLSSIYLAKGDLDTALEYEFKTMELFEQLGNKLETAMSYQNVGLIKYYFGDLHLARQRVEKSLNLLEKTNNPLVLSNGLFLLLRIHLDLDHKDIIIEYKKKLTNLKKTTDNPVVNLRADLAEALYLMGSKRPSGMFKAFGILDRLSSADPIDHELSILARYSLCELQLYELELTDEEHIEPILQDIRTNINELTKIAEKTNSQSVLIRTMLLQSKIELINNPVQSMEYVKAAEEMAERYKLKSYAGTIALQKELAKNEMQEWEERSVKDQLKRLNLNQYTQLLARQREETSMFLHDISNLLQINLNYANILQFDQSISHDSAKYVSSIQSTGVQIKTLVESLKQIIALDNQKTEITYRNEDIREIIDQVCDLYHLRAEEKNLQVSINYPDDLPLLVLNRDLVERVIGNLVSNAIKYAPDESEIKINVQIYDPYWRFAICNEGDKINEDEMNLIFTKFYRLTSHRTQTQYHGTGLGLAFCKSACQAMGGDIQVISPAPNKDDGVCFHVELPLSNQD